MNLPFNPTLDVLRDVFLSPLFLIPFLLFLVIPCFPFLYAIVKGLLSLLKDGIKVLLLVVALAVIVKILFPVLHAALMLMK